MSGAAGHLKHLHENLELTFKELKDVLTHAAEGKLEHVTEKLDGMNIMFSWNELEGRLVVARNLTDIRRGGVDPEQLKQRFNDKEHVTAAFDSACKVLNDVLSTVPRSVRRNVFGWIPGFWYSVEVVYASDPNTIRYSRNSLVFHTHPVLDSSGKHTEWKSGAEWLAQNIEKYQQAVSMRDWRVMGPARVDLEALADRTHLDDALTEIDDVMAEHGMTDGDTLRAYLRSCFTREAIAMPLPRGVAQAIADNACGWPGKMTLTNIKLRLTQEQKSYVDSFSSDVPAMTKEFIAPIEHAIIMFTAKLLAGIKTALVDDRDGEVTRLRKRVKKAIELIQSSGNVEALAVLNRELQRLGSIDNITSPTEGIVFTYKGQTYKFTGAFAPVHQILALFKYGRKGVKLGGLDEE